MWWLEETYANFKGFNISELKTDEAWLNISSSLEQPLWLYILSDDCHKCSFQKFVDEPILPNHFYKAIVSAQHGLTFRLRTSGDFNYTPSVNDSLWICDVQSKLGQFGVYSLHVQNDAYNQNSVHCSLETDLQPVNTFIPILVTLLFCLFVGVILKYVIKYWRWILCYAAEYFVTNNRNHEDEAPLTTGESDSQEPTAPTVNSKETRKAEKISIRKRSLGKRKKNAGTRSQLQDNDALSADNVPSTSTSHMSTHTQNESVIPSSLNKERLKSLDVFRGISIIIMMYADDGGGGYYFFRHCTWDGLYVADLAFPWFLWICGASIPFSIHSRHTGGISKMNTFKEIIFRSLKLIFLGIVVNTSTRNTPVQLENLRLPGVLQRFGISYLVGASLLLMFYKDPNSSPNDTSSSQEESWVWKRHFIDFKSTFIPWCLVLILVGIHTTIIFYLPVPQCPSGYLGPAGLHNDNAYPPHCVGGATGYVDRLIFGIHHIHNRPTSKKLYGSGAFDPEGALGILTSILHIMLGIQAGSVILTYKTTKSRVMRLLLWTVICGVGGFVLCGGISNSGLIPVNKNLWSLSFVLVTSSSAMGLLTLLFLVIDAKQIWNGSPVMEAGRNSILLYLGHEACHAMLPWHFSYGRMILHTNKLLETFWGIGVWIMIAIYLHENKLFFVL